MIKIILDWLTSNYFEIFAAISGFVYIYFSIKQKIWLWLTGIITSAMYVLVYYDAKFYADMSLQFYYLAISIYGWWFWIKKSKLKNDNKSFSPTKTPLKIGIFLFLITIILVLLIGYILDNYTDSPIPYSDAFTTAASITATWMITRKYIEQWLIWIIVDLTSLGLYVYKDLYPTAVLFLVYTVLAVFGYFEWEKERKKNFADIKAIIYENN